MKIETWPIDKVIPYARNPRKNDASVDAVAASIKEFGWRVPIVVDEAGVIITGHTRLKAARRLGMDKVPVHVATDLTPAQVKAYRIADNSAGSKSEWDADLLKIELDDLPDFDAAEFNLDLDALGMDDAPEGEADAEPQVDRAEELRGGKYRRGTIRATATARRTRSNAWPGRCATITRPKSTTHSSAAARRW